MKSLGLSIKLGDRKTEKDHSSELVQNLKDGFTSVYYIYFNPVPIFDKYHVEVLYGLNDQYKNLVPRKSGHNIYKFKDPKKAVGFFLKKKREKLNKGYTELFSIIKPVERERKFKILKTK